MSNIRSKLLIFCVSALSMSCAPTTYYNPNPDSDWERDSARCEAYSLSNSPMPEYNTPLFNHQISGTGIVGGQFYSFSGTIAPNPFQGLQDGMNSIAVLGYRDKLYELCLKSLGWKEVKDGQDSSNSGNNGTAK